jgi:hypothetical protein
VKLAEATKTSTPAFYAWPAKIATTQWLLNPNFRQKNTLIGLV